MTEPSAPATTAGLLTRVDASWQAIEAAVARLDPDRARAPAVGGWSANDHLAHLATWRLSLLALLEGRSRPRAIGIEPEQEEALSLDGINALIYERNRDRSLDAVLADLRDAHGRVRAALDRLSDGDLMQPYSYYQPDDPTAEPAPVIGWIIGNTYEHDAEHLPAVQAAGR